MLDDDNINGTGEEEISRRGQRKKVVDVVKLSDGDRRRLIDKLIESVKEDNLLFLKKLRDRIDRLEAYIYIYNHIMQKLIKSIVGGTFVAT